MIPVIDLDAKGLTPTQILRLAKRPNGVLLRKGGRVIGRISPADDLDLADEVWAHAPKQVARGAAARRRFAAGKGVSHAEVRRNLGIRTPRRTR